MSCGGWTLRRRTIWREWTRAASTETQLAEPCKQALRYPRGRHSVVVVVLLDFAVERVNQRAARRVKFSPSQAKITCHPPRHLWSAVPAQATSCATLLSPPMWDILRLRHLHYRVDAVQVPFKPTSNSCTGKVKISAFTSLISILATCWVTSIPVCTLATNNYGQIALSKTPESHHAR